MSSPWCVDETARVLEVDMGLGRCWQTHPRCCAFVAELLSKPISELSVMITLEFLVDEDELRESMDVAPELASSAAIEQTYFEMPVRFRVGETELLTYSGAFETWRPLPIVGFSLQLLRAARAVTREHSATCHLSDGGRLEFQGAGETTRVWSSLLPGRVESVTTAELVEAVRSFRCSVQEFLERRVPAMKTHPWWTNWFSDGAPGLDDR